jgi:hypothetical protein
MNTYQDSTISRVALVQCTINVEFLVILVLSTYHHNSGKRGISNRIVRGYWRINTRKEQSLSFRIIILLNSNHSVYISTFSYYSVRNTPFPTTVS